MPMSRVSNSCRCLCCSICGPWNETNWRWLAGAAVMQALSALSCWYFLFYTLYFFAFHLLYLRL